MRIPEWAGPSNKGSREELELKPRMSGLEEAWGWVRLRGQGGPGQ